MNLDGLLSHTMDSRRMASSRLSAPFYTNNSDRRDKAESFLEVKTLTVAVTLTVTLTLTLALTLTLTLTLTISLTLTLNLTHLTLTLTRILATTL